MGDDRYDRGWARLQDLAGAQGTDVIERVREISPDLARFVVEFGYADIYSRDAIDDHARQVAAISSLVTQGSAEPQLEYHIGIALNVGLSPEAIVETIVFLAPFVGFPRVLNALRSVKRVFAARGVTPRRS
jgi:4-carboxymuconolactone decarboxylase